MLGTVAVEEIDGMAGFKATPDETGVPSEEVDVASFEGEERLTAVDENGKDAADDAEEASPPMEAPCIPSAGDCKVKEKLGVDGMNGAEDATGVEIGTDGVTDAAG